MQIKLGEKIKELRKRDGRKQEDLANALGVTAQAVSRWESNGCYPDMSMIPAIANYFHVTIDTLFGYNSDRDIKIKDYVKKANSLLVGEEDEINECIRLMKKALEEFPAEPELQMCLAHGLKLKGFKENEKKGEQYRGEAVLALLHELRFAIEFAIVKNEKIANSKEGIDILLSVRQLYEKIFGEECYGKFHSDMCMIDLCCVKIASNIKDYDEALTFFDSAYVHYTKFLELQKGYCFEDEHYDTLILDAVGNTSIPVSVCKSEYLEASILYLPKEVKARIMNNPKYVDLFGK